LRRVYRATGRGQTRGVFRAERRLDFAASVHEVLHQGRPLPIVQPGIRRTPQAATNHQVTTIRRDELAQGRPGTETGPRMKRQLLERAARRLRRLVMPPSHLAHRVRYQLLEDRKSTRLNSSHVKI